MSVTAQERTGRVKFSRADRAEILARVEDGETYVAVGEMFGVSRSLIGNIVDQERKREAAKLHRSSQDAVDALALQLRARAALQLVEDAEPEQRFALLAEVVDPSPELDEVTRQRAAAILNGDVGNRKRIRRGLCAGCGRKIDDSNDQTPGCRACSARQSNRRRRGWKGSEGVAA